MGVDKRLIKHKRLLSDLLEKEKVYRNKEVNNGNDEGTSTDSDAEESAFENSQVDATEDSDQEIESDNEEAYDSDSKSTK